MKTFSSLKWLIAICGILALAGYKSYQQWQEWMEPASSQPSYEIVEVKKGASFRQIALELENRGIIRSRDAFFILAWRRDELSSIKAGEYKLSPSMRPEEILQILVEGRTVQHLVTIPEGYNRFQIAKVLDDAGLIEKEAFLKASSDKAILKAQEIPADTAEGYLFPESYMLPRKTSAADAVMMFTSQFWKIWKDNGFQERAKELGKDVHYIVTLASIVEMEAAVPEEKPIIASVFWNRLKKGMPLQADPTVKYGLLVEKGIKRKRLSKKDLRTPTAYNTYLLPGLPKGPISNPGLLSLKATLYPAETDYLFFVAKGKRRHKFSKTLKEHNRAVRKYILKR